MRTNLVVLNSHPDYKKRKLNSIKLDTRVSYTCCFCCWKMYKAHLSLKQFWKPVFKKWKFGQRKHISSSSPYATCHQKWWINQNIHFFDSIAWRAWWAQVLFPLNHAGLCERFLFSSLIHIYIQSSGNVPYKLCNDSHKPNELLASFQSKTHSPPNNQAGCAI